MDYVDLSDRSTMPLTFVRDGDPSSETFTVEDLMNGFVTHLRENERLQIVFDVKVKDGVDLPDTLNNTVTVNSLTADASIEARMPSYTSVKLVLDGNRNGYAEAGEALEYTITVKNDGDVVIKDVFVQDTLNDIMDHIQNPGDVVVTDGTNNYTLADLATGITIDRIEAGEFVNVKFTVVLLDTLDVGTIRLLKNVATVNDENPGVEIPTGEAVITATKSVVDDSGDGFAEAGEALFYTISLENTGVVLARDVLIQDELAELIDHIDSPDDVVVMVGSVEYTLQDLMSGIRIDVAVDEMIDVEFMVTLKEDFDAKTITTLKNIATVHNENPEVEIPTGYSSLKPSKEVSDENGNGYAEAGEELTYKITVTNTGSVRMSRVHIQDELEELLPHIVDPDDVVISVTEDGITTLHSLQTLIEGQSISLNAKETIEILFTVTLSDDFDAREIADLTNIAVVNEEDVSTTIPTGYPDINAQKVVVDGNENGFAEAGEDLTYTITFSNTGLVGAEKVLVKDDLSELIDHIDNPDGVQVMVNSAEYTLQNLIDGIEMDLGVGELVDVEFTVTLKDDFDAKTIRTLKNIATVYDNEPEVEIPTGYSEISPSKDVYDGNENGYAEAGEELTYTISVVNTGSVMKEKVHIQEEMKDLLAHISSSDSVVVYATHNGNTTTHSLDALIDGIMMDLGAGERVDFVFTVTLNEDFDAKMIHALTNLAVVDEEELETTIPTGYVDLVVGKSVVDGNENNLAEQGETLTYTIHIQNMGNIVAKDVHVQDDLKNLINHLKDRDYMVMMGDVEMSLHELIEGFHIDVDKDGELVVVFTVHLKEDFDIKNISELMNTVVVNDLEAHALIKTYVKPEAEPKQPRTKIIPVMMKLPSTGRSISTGVIISSLLLGLGIALVLKDREDDE